MISRKEFQNSEEYHVKSHKELIQKAESLRKEEKDKPYTIYIENQEEEQGNLIFPYSHFYIISKGKSLISYLYANQKDKNGNDLTTWKTPALKITGNNNIFENLIIENRSGNPETKGQEVALGIYGDNNLFLNCTFKSTQDTLFVGPLPDDLSTRYIDFLSEEERYHEGNTTNYFHNCQIEGTVDFIFGAGKAVFDRCELKTVYDKRKETYVVAGAHSLKDDFGFLFYECKFQKGKDVEDNSTYLARPWRDYSKNVFVNCTYDSHIKKEGFSDWSNVNRTRTARFLEYPYHKERVDWIKTNKYSILDQKYEKAIECLKKAIK